MIGLVYLNKETSKINHFKNSVYIQESLHDICMQMYIDMYVYNELFITLCP